MVNTLLSIALVIVISSITITLFRFIKGTSAFDRVIALDIMTIASVALIAILASYNFV